MKEATITRTFEAPRERVWEALTTPEGLAAWFFTAPYTLPAERVTIELRPGGAFEATMVHSGDGSELPFSGRYEEVEEPVRIVQALHNPADPAVETLTYTLVDLGDGRTETTYHQVGHLPDEQYPLIEQGVNGFWDQLEAHLAQ
jgi:uncharacterized protein YndB with AHSA1/START domain